MKREPSIIHLCIYEKLCKEAKIENIIGRPMFHKIIGRVYHIPKVNHRKVLNEFKELGFVLEKDKYSLIVLKV